MSPAVEPKLKDALLYEFSDGNVADVDPGMTDP